MAAVNSRPRSPGVLYAALTLIVLLLVGILALSQRQPPPPSIAEFAPQATEQITDAPDDQSSSSGRSAGAGGGVSDTTSTPTPSAQDAIDVPRVRKCVGDPPRQIEDPQSPPCVPFWQGDNGGATSKGVTRDEIRVAIAGATDTRIEAFFNRRFEFYGRKIRLLPFVPRGRNRASVDAMQADAVHVESMGAFAELSYSGDQYGGSSTFYDELARRRIISVQSSYTGSPASSEAQYQRFAPYQWNYMPSGEKVVRSYASWICRSLAHRPPAYGGPFIPAPTKRVFGVLTSTNVNGSELDIAPLIEAGKDCGVDFVVVRTDAEDVSAGTGIVTKFKAEEVTSIVSFVNGQLLMSSIMPAATGQEYFPEWLISDYFHAQDDLMGRQAPPEHGAHLFGLRSWNKSLPHDQMPYFWALKESDPSATVDPVNNFNFTYWNLLVVASGIQMAGPRLTPEAFQAGLFKTAFPNPGCGGAPFYQGCVGFGPLNHTMIQDFAQIWFNGNAPSYDVENAVGAYCYAEQGKRWSPETTPSGDPMLFQPPCR